jgi:4-amino-4-deoxy-L-arabinose transferase-like glycosyltransferase
MTRERRPVSAPAPSGGSWRRRAQDIHPPLYYLLLHAWGAVAGRSVFALRAFSALAGVLLIAATGAMAARLFGRRAAGLAMLLMAAHPLAVYYAQEVRMYALLGLWAALHSLFFLAWRARPRPGRALGLLLTGAAGLYTHYVFPAIPAAHGLIMLGEAMARGRWHRLIRWLGLQAWIGLAFLPWAPAAFAQLRQWPAPAPVPLPEAFQAILRALGWGITLPPEVPPLVLVIPLGGIAFALAGSERRGGGIGLALTLAPVALVLGRGAYREANLKFFMAALPAFVALWAAGLAAMGKLRGPAGKAAFVFALGLVALRWASACGPCISIPVSPGTITGAWPGPGGMGPARGWDPPLRARPGGCLHLLLTGRPAGVGAPGAAACAGGDREDAGSRAARARPAVRALVWGTGGGSDRAGGGLAGRPRLPGGGTVGGTDPLRRLWAGDAGGIAPPEFGSGGH